MQPEQPDYQQPPQVQPDPPAMPQPSYEQVPAQPQEVEEYVDEVPAADAITWQAPEYIEQAREPIWYIGFWAVVVILMVLAAFIVKSWSFAILVPAMAAALMIYSHRPPHILNYALSNKGLYINDQLHPLEEFRSFGVLKEDVMPSLMLIPTKRFRPGLTVYFPAEQGERIVDFLGGRMAMQDLKLDVFDKIVRKLRM